MVARKQAADKSAVYIARRTAVVSQDGATVRVRRGITRVAGDSPLVAAHPDLFQPAEEGVSFPTRTARAEPKVEQAGDDSGKAGDGK